MPALTDQQHYENSEFWGEHQYLTLENILDNIILKADDDSYFKKLSRKKASINAKQGLKKLEIDVAPKSKAISFQLSPVKTFPYPRFMTNWYRISVVTDCNNLVVLEVNNDERIHDYLQDNNYELLYDNNGEVLEGKPQNLEFGTCVKFLNCDGKIEPDKNTEQYQNSWVKDIKDGNYFEFSDDLVDKEIVIEYQLSGLSSMNDCDIKVHNDLELTLEYYIKWKTLEDKRNVAATKIQYYRDLYKIEKRRSSVLLAAKITLNQILESISLSYY